MMRTLTSPRATRAGNDLVKDEQHVVPVANLAQVRQVFVRRVDDAARVPNRFEGRGVQQEVAVRTRRRERLGFGASQNQPELGLQ